MRKSLWTITLALVLLMGCEDDNNLGVDEVQEFVFLSATSFSISESNNTTPETAIEIHAEYLGFDTREVDIIVELSVEATNATEGVDYEIVSPSNTITIPAGSFTSQVGFRIHAIDDILQALDDRFITVSIASVSDSDLNIGKGLSNPTEASAIVSIEDDECPDTIDKFNGATWAFAGSNTVYYSDYAGTYTTSVSGNTMTISGDIANYDVGLTMEATLTPDQAGATTGIITFNSSTEGMDNAGYTYRWILKSGTYNICAETMTLVTTLQFIDIYGPDPTAWVDWYDSDITASVESLAGEGPNCAASSWDGRLSNVASSFTAFNSDFFYDDYDNSYTDLGLSLSADCGTLTVSGDFLDLGALVSDITIEFNLQPDAGDENQGVLDLATQVLGSDGSGFEYRVRSTGAGGTYNLSDGTFDIELFVDYDDNGAGYVNWYTANSTFTVQ